MAKYEDIIDNVAADTMLPIEIVEKVADIFFRYLRDELSDGKSRVDVPGRAVIQAFNLDDDRHGAIVKFHPWKMKVG